MAETGNGVASDTGAFGPTVVALVVALYGVLWTVSGFAAVYARHEPGFLALMSPFAGLALLLVAVGLAERRRSAWALTVTTFAAILAWETLRMGTPSLGSAPLVPALIVVYLVAKREPYRRDAGV